MYAVVQTGGKQYRVSEGDTIKVEKLAVDAGDSIELDKVLLLADGDDVKIGAPYIDGSKVTDHIYTQEEISALNGGGTQRLYTGNTLMGNHKLGVRFRQSLKDGRLQTN